MEPGVECLLEASIKMECSMEVTARALVLYHNFMRCIDQVQYDHVMVAAASLNLSSRVCEEPLDIEMVILTFYRMVNKTSELLNPDTESFGLLKKSLIIVDYVMQRMLEFTLNFRIAHQYLIPFLDVIHNRSRNIKHFHQHLNVTCIKFISDFYTSRKCLNYNPEHIAIGCIDAALHIHGFVHDLEMADPWYDGFCHDLTDDKVKNLKIDLFNLYKNDKEQKIVAPAVDVVLKAKDTSSTESEDSRESS